MLSISFSDILQFPVFRNLTEEDLLPTSMDKNVMPYLFLLGGDSKRGYEIICNKHRNLNNKVITGMRYVMDCRSDYEYLHSKRCSTIDRIIAAGAKDPSLAFEMGTLLSQSFDFNSFHEGGIGNNESGRSRVEFPVELIEDDWKETEEYIDIMNKHILEVRGSPLKENGGLKGLAEYDLSVKGK